MNGLLTTRLAFVSLELAWVMRRSDMMDTVLWQCLVERFTGLNRSCSPSVCRGGELNDEKQLL
jgi:hypothetical protein